MDGIILEEQIPFNEDKFVWGHSLQVLPLVVDVMVDTEILSGSVGNSKCDWDQVLLAIDAPEITQS